MILPINHTPWQSTSRSKKLCDKYLNLKPSDTVQCVTFQVERCGVRGKGDLLPVTQTCSYLSGHGYTTGYSSHLHGSIRFVLILQVTCSNVLSDILRTDEFKTTHWQLCILIDLQKEFIIKFAGLSISWPPLFCNLKCVSDGLLSPCVFPVRSTYALCGTFYK